MLESILGWIGNILFIYGVYALGKKRIIGFYANTFANLLYFAQAIIMNNNPLIWLSIGLGYLNVKGIIEWRKDEKKIN